MKKNELEFFRKILNERKEQIIQNINSSVDDIRGLKDSSDASDEIDVASVDTDITLGYAMIQKLSQELKEIDESLGKINAKTYGVCEMCEEEISMARFRAKPTAKYCIVCREIIEKGKK